MTNLQLHQNLIFGMAGIHADAYRFSNCINQPVVRYFVGKNVCFVGMPCLVAVCMRFQIVIDRHISGGVNFGLCTHDNK